MTRDWLSQAACGQADPSLFEPVAIDDRDVEALAHRAAAARAICARCPVIEECAADAIDNRMSGVWGGQMLEFGKPRPVPRPGTVRPRRGGRPLAPCGTRTAYERHIARGEPVDDDCRAAAAEYRRSHRQPKPGRPPAPCGTRAAYVRHRRRGEPIDDACRAAPRHRTAAGAAA